MYQQQIKRTLEIFCPSVPMIDANRFVGREQECSELIRSILSPGKHAVVFGNRGVGKTSTTKIVAESFESGGNFQIIEYNCGKRDTYLNICYKILEQLDLLSHKRIKSEAHERVMDAKIKVLLANGGAKSVRKTENEYVQQVDSEITPDRFVSIIKTENAIVIIDEFDQIKDDRTKEFFAETIKTLSDNSSPFNVVICGVSNTAEKLFGEHKSTVRNISPIYIPYMSGNELKTLINNGLNEIGIYFSEKLKNAIINLSEGLPYFTHLLCEELCIHAIETKKSSLRITDLSTAVVKATKNISGLIAGPYILAVNTEEADNISPFRYTPQTPKELRRIVIHCVALAKNNKLESISEVVNHYINEYGTSAPSNCEEIDEIEIEVIINDINILSGCITMTDDKVFFSSPFLKVYALLKVLEHKWEFAHAQTFLKSTS